jgi:protoheme IX farnesyltransferase
VGLHVFRAYYALAKPGIIRGNLMVVAAAFLFASKGTVDWWLLLETLAGVALVIASGCVFNNYIDRGIDKKMARTQNRALVTGEISGRAALTYAVLLGVAGFGTLAYFTHWLTVAVGFLGLFCYVVVYGIGKRRTVHGTIIGSISGALPPVAGYVAVTNRLDGAALLLFLVLVVWQMPHFYAIAMFRRDDYSSAGLPVLPVVRGMAAAKLQIVLYILAFVMVTTLMTTLGYAGWLYFAVMTAVGVVWTMKAYEGLKATDDVRWARKMFGYSLIALLAWSAAIAADGWLF